MAPSASATPSTSTSELTPATRRGGKFTTAATCRPINCSHVYRSVSWALEVRVPKDPGEDSPMKSNEQWTVVAATRDAAGRAQLDLPGSPKSRYWLVYLTSLPGVEDGYFRGGIAAIEALGY